MNESFPPVGFDVSILGLGQMGAACARALLRKGHRVAVWNRTSSKAASLRSEGAVVLDTPSEAVRASALSIISVSDHTAVLDILKEPGVAASLAGRLLLQTASGTKDELAIQQQIVHGQGGRFLAGIFLTFPSGLGQPHATAICAGDCIVSERQGQILADIARFQYLGLPLSSLIGAFLGVGHLMMSTLVLYFEAAAVARHFDVPIDSFCQVAMSAREETWRILSESTDRIRLEKYDASEAYIDALAGGMPSFLAMLRESGTPVLMAESMVRQLEYAYQRGGKGKDISFLANALRGSREIPS
jgi:3-hydroxyisobutyrate dehydrogenase-like beta-hydroxyacid dehydrogenase